MGGGAGAGAGKSEEDMCSTQLIFGDGTFNVDGLDNFSKTVKLGDCGLSYAVISIVGPQSSGKSTLLNHLFGTNFVMMNEERGWSQTTKGIWLAKCAGTEPCTIALDLEGSDGKEREDDIVFEKQSALFALAVSDIVLINMKCHDTGREQGGGRALLKIVFEVMMRLFCPRQTILLFVIRDITKKTSLEILEETLNTDMRKLYDSITKPDVHKGTTLSDFFKVKVTALPNYEERREEFEEQVKILKKELVSIISDGLVGDRRDRVPASAFPLSAKTIWNTIKDNRDLDLPAHKVMVANTRCEEIARESFVHFSKNEDWLQLERSVHSGPVSSFGKSLTSIINACLSQYDADTVYFDEGSRIEKRNLLQDNVLQCTEPAYRSLLENLHSRILCEFKQEFTQSLNQGGQFIAVSRQCSQHYMSKFGYGCTDAAIEQANWDASTIFTRLHHDINEHIATICASKLSRITLSYKDNLSSTLPKPVEDLLNEAKDKTWSTVRNLFRQEMKSIEDMLSKDIFNFGADSKKKDEMLASIEKHARDLIHTTANSNSKRILVVMKDRFSTVFLTNLPQSSTNKDDIIAVTKMAKSASLDLLCVMAADLLEDDADSIPASLRAALEEISNSATDKSTRKTSIANKSKSSGQVASSTWEKVPSTKTLLTPDECRSLWKQFEKDVSRVVSSAYTNLENNIRVAAAVATAAKAMEERDAAAKAHIAAEASAKEAAAAAKAAADEALTAAKGAAAEAAAIKIAAAEAASKKAIAAAKKAAADEAAAAANAASAAHAAAIAEEKRRNFLSDMLRVIGLHDVAANLENMINGIRNIFS